MNPFQRLRQAIDQVNVVYQFQEECQGEGCEGQAKTTAPAGGYVHETQNNVTVSNHDQIQRIKEISQTQQLSSIRHITEQASKIEQLQKQLKRSQAAMQGQLEELVELEKQNESLKVNLSQQYAAVVQCDEKERKFKEEIHRINVTINELAVQIQTERNAKKQLSREVEGLRGKAAAAQAQWVDYRETSEKERLRIVAELEERRAMFEYNIMKASDDRQQFKLTLSEIEKSHSQQLKDCRVQIDRLKYQLLSANKSVQIEGLNCRNVEDTLRRERQELLQLRSANKQLNTEVSIKDQQFVQSQKNNSELQKNLSSLGSELQEQKKNLKVKVVEVRDQTLSMQLEMYKRQCRELLQEKTIMRSLSNGQLGELQPQYSIVNAPQSDAF